MTSDLRVLLGRQAFAAATDAELLGRYASERDDVAFAELVHRHAPAVYAACRRFLADPASLDDAFQAVFVLLSRKAAGLANPEKLSGWLCGAAGRIARKLRDRTAKRAAAERPLEEVPQPQPCEPDSADLKAVLDEELARLPAAYREAVLLCDVQGLPRRTASKQLGVPQSTLSNRLTRARAMLGTRLLRRGVALGAGLALTSVAIASVPGRLVSLTVSRITTDAVPANVSALAPEGVPTMPSFKTACVLLAGLLLATVAFAPPASGEPVKPVVPKPAAVDPPDPEPEEMKGRNWVSASAYSRDGKRLALVRTDTKELKLYDTATWKVLHTLEGMTELSHAVVFTADGKTLYAASYDGKLYSWDTKTGKAGEVLNPKAGPCTGLVLSPDGKTLASGHHDPDAGTTAIHLWDAATGKPGKVIAADDPLLPNSIAFTPDGKTIAGGYHSHHKKNPDPAGFHGVIEWEVATGKEQKRYSTPRITAGASPVAHAVAYTKDGKKLILGGGEAVPVPGRQGATMLYGSVWVFDRKTGEVDRTLVSDRSDYVRMLALSPDGGKLYVPASTFAARAPQNRALPDPPCEFQCWDTETWEMSWAVAHRTPRSVSGVAVSPDGKRVAVSDGEGYHLFDTKTGEGKGGLITIVRPK